MIVHRILPVFDPLYTVKHDVHCQVAISCCRHTYYSEAQVFSCESQGQKYLHVEASVHFNPHIICHFGCLGLVSDKMGISVLGDNVPPLILVSTSYFNDRTFHKMDSTKQQLLEKDCNFVIPEFYVITPQDPRTVYIKIVSWEQRIQYSRMGWDVTVVYRK